ncbi:hypothetical protein SAMN05421741_109100 [Paenimyroides ummariense]|uniref:Uncharacterized protein n=1 Tax=Paenimyroides ummariense TaxID=913024 RepID=A0A1I5B882_9FLAO|nr:hypothetical protein [Paenimyroides ummariense]SFN70915.1 hypothetical protein SAMN05421741_109100 [Paenimyroides ummariense]
MWVENNKMLDIDYLRSYEKDYVKFRIGPWGRFIINNIEFPQPKKMFKREFINGLIDIYTSWQDQLNKLNEPYYLKIWLFEKDLKKSQVVCAINSKIDFYVNTFEKTDTSKHSNKLLSFKNSNPKLNDFQWEMALDNLYVEDDIIQNKNEYSNERDYLEAKKWFNKVVLKEYKRIEIFEGNRSFYVLDNDVVWIGERK